MSFYYFSPTTMSFYDSESEGYYRERGMLPEDSIEITAEEHTELFNGQSIGKQIYLRSDGKPGLRNPPKDPVTAIENNREVATLVINQLSEAEEDGDLTPEEAIDLAALRAYRTKLRRLDVTGLTYEQVEWPEPPALIAASVI